jgi:hypothetical protein
MGIEQNPKTKSHAMGSNDFARWIFVKSRDFIWRQHSTRLLEAVLCGQSRGAQRITALRD